MQKFYASIVFIFCTLLAFTSSSFAQQPPRKITSSTLSPNPPTKSRCFASAPTVLRSKRNSPPA